MQAAATRASPLTCPADHLKPASQQKPIYSLIWINQPLVGFGQPTQRGNVVGETAKVFEKNRVGVRGKMHESKEHRSKAVCFAPRAWVSDNKESSRRVAG